MLVGKSLKRNTVSNSWTARYDGKDCRPRHVIECYNYYSLYSGKQHSSVMLCTHRCKTTNRWGWLEVQGSGIFVVTIVACVAENNLVACVGVTSSTYVAARVHGLGRGKCSTSIIVIRLQVERSLCLGIPTTLRSFRSTQGSEQTVLWHSN